MANNSQIVLGLYGMPGAGKSTASDILKDMGAGIISLDELGHEMLECADVKTSIKMAFGKNVFSSHGVISREALAEVVFSNSQKLEKLNSIIHPAMIKEVETILKEVSEDAELEVVVIEGALLLKMELERLCDKVIRIEADKQIRHERMIATRQWTKEECEMRDAAQSDARADLEIIIDNSSTPEELRQSITSLLEEIE